MKERPILFSAPMVRAILDGSKTQTRRVVKGNPVHVLQFIDRDNKPTSEFGFCATHDRVINKHIMCPYGQPGDRLWVRETTCADHETYGAITLAKYAADGSPVLYSGPSEDENGDPDFGGSRAHWWCKRESCPSIHMPRWASRITLEITGVRVELLQAISEADAISEGLKICPNMNGMGHTGYVFPDCDYDKAGLCHSSPWTAFYQGWELINGPDSWDSNPWVWVVEFKRVEESFQ